MKPGTFREYSNILAVGPRLLDGVLIATAKAAAWAAYVGYWGYRDTVLAAVAVGAYWFMAEANGVYRSWRGARVRDELRSVLWSWLLTGTILLIWLFATKTSENHSRVATFSWFIGTAVLLAVSRSLKNTVLGLFMANGRSCRVAALVGATPVALRLLDELADPAHGIKVKGIYDFRSYDRVKDELRGERLEGSFSDLVEQARSGEVDYVYITLPLRAEARIAEAVGALADTTATVQLVTDFSAFDLLRAHCASVGGIPAISLFDTPFNGSSGALKRAEDLFLGIVLLVLASPVMLIVALAIKLTSKGPIFTVQTRNGLGGKPIEVLSFRTTETEGHGDAAKRDARLTPIGAFLRASSLAELPQVINVLRGEMSIVGPRPHPIAQNEAYRNVIHGYMLRHKVKPGITGWAQVHEPRGRRVTMESAREDVEYDLEYIEKWDLRWDLEIIIRTALRAWRERRGDATS